MYYFANIALALDIFFKSSQVLKHIYTFYVIHCKSSQSLNKVVIIEIGTDNFAKHLTAFTLAKRNNGKTKK